MKMITILLVIGFINVSASVYSQKAKINLDLKNASLEDVLWAIQEQSEFVFLYSTDDVKKVNNIDLSVREGNIETILTECLSDSDLKYSIKHKTVVISVDPSAGKTKHVFLPIELPQPVITISGKVVDDKGIPLPGVNIVIEGTTTGTITQLNGEYFINVSGPEDVLVFSYVGYMKQSVIVGDRKVIDITMLPDVAILEDVVVVGYGKQKRESVTAAISSVTSNDIARNPVSNVSQSLTGRLPGLTTVQQSGEPGNDNPIIKIRGVSTLSEGSRSDPLILVDGVPRESMNLIDPNEIENITILKDASATAVYGVRGANGVILINTKTGIEGRKPAINFTSNLSIQNPIKLPQFLNSYEWAVLKNEGLLNDGGVEIFPEDLIQAFKDHTNPVLYPDIDWVKEIIRPVSLQQQYNLNISGSSDIVRYFVSVGYFTQDGAYKLPEGLDTDLGFEPNPKAQRYNFRSNFDVNITQDFTASVRLGYINRNLNYPGESSTDLMFKLMQVQPYSNPPVVDGKFVNGYLNDPLLQVNRMTSPFGNIIQNGYQTFSDNTLNTNIELRHKLDFITKGLSVRAMAAYDGFYNHEVFRNKKTDEYTIYCDDSLPEGYFLVKTTDEGNFGFSESYDKWRNVYMESSLNYDREFGDHSVTGLLLYNQQKYHDPDLQFQVPQSMMGLVSRVTYNYKSKYLAEFNMGYNGSENFPKGKRFGFFPAYSFGWVPTMEKFFPENDILTYLKLRGSYGEVGNDKIGGDRFLYLPSSFSFTSNNTSDGYYFGMYGVNRQRYIGSQEDKIGNPNVTWERAKKMNIGMEMRFLQGKFSFEGDYFQEDRDGILINLQTIPMIVAAELPAANLGKVQNKGFEMQGRWRSNIGNLNYELSGNMSFARNKILFADEPVLEYEWLQETGFSVGQTKAKRTEGLYNSWQEVNNRPYYGFYGNAVQPGDIKYVDINGDGLINFLDIVPTGFSKIPEITWGSSFRIQFKKFEMYVLFQGAQNIWSNFRLSLGNAFQYGTRATLKEHVNRWNQERYEAGETITRPRLSNDSALSPNGEAAGYSDFWMVDASYLRLKNLELSYRFDNLSLNKIGIESLRIYLNGNNLITLSDVDVGDAEMGSNTQMVYPLVRVFNAGINITF